MDWQGSNIRVAIDENCPQDRNYIIFLVVEETFGSISQLTVTKDRQQTVGSSLSLRAC